MRLFLFTVFCGLALSTHAVAMEIEIKNCAGQSTASYDVNDGLLATVNIALKNFSETITGAELISDSGTTLRSESHLGTVVFDGVKPGAWRFCMSEPTAEIERVSVLPSTEEIASEDRTQIAAIGAGLLGVGSLAAFGSGGGSGGKSNQALASSTSSEISFAATGGSSTSGVGGNSGVNIQNQSSAPCYIGEDVTPMSPFS